MPMMVFMAIDLIDAKFASSGIGDIKCDTARAVSDVVLGRPDPHGGGRQLLFGRVPLPGYLDSDDLFQILWTAINGARKC